MVYIVAQK